MHRPTRQAATDGKQRTRRMLQEEERPQSPTPTPTPEPEADHSNTSSATLRPVNASKAAPRKFPLKIYLFDEAQLCFRLDEEHDFSTPEVSDLTSLITAVRMLRETRHKDADQTKDGKFDSSRNEADSTVYRCASVSGTAGARTCEFLDEHSYKECVDKLKRDGNANPEILIVAYHSPHVKEFAATVKNLGFPTV